MLDASEYLHLAIHASQQDDHHAALNYLGQALELEPENAAVRYFLAAEHAELGLYERAVSGMKEALALDEGLDIARFQLGLLSLQLQRLEEAREAFATLADRTVDEGLKAFSSAYLDLLDEKVSDACRKLEHGLAVCTNEALVRDMSRVLGSLAEGDGAEAVKGEETGSVYLGAYRDSVEPS
ncbi:hypothetical protein N5C55_27635 [Pseudomonas otitidis]|uniref:tetratricopeptide repeat protein n=1 Tax=Metapseudomonas otitidis TaxID=319939 RepID=UPI00244A553E|nr:tetratricopeptide repeat protein [Pseudomonas otitidis]MDH1104512.1 hypothetical protein [Pseudomonas otitidis]MDH1161963.1 hypothetical protein [Pseudomonas otitidis]MDH1167801.1 hypothetical protein [Pseudomonas otitidis]